MLLLAKGFGRQIQFISISTELCVEVGKAVKPLLVHLLNLKIYWEKMTQTMLTNDWQTFRKK